MPLRHALRCDDLPRQIQDADVYSAHPAFLAAIYPVASNRFEWFFFVCRGRRPGGRRRAGPGTYRLAGEAKLLRGSAYCHTFRYYEDMAEVGSASARKTEWRMDEYGACGPDSPGAGAFDMVVRNCKVYPARGGFIHERLGVDRAVLPSRRRRADADVKPQVLVQLYLTSLNLGDPGRCRMHPAIDVCAAHPAVLTTVFPAANDRCDGYSPCGARPPRTVTRTGRTRGARGQGGATATSWTASAGTRGVFWYREDDATVRQVSRTEWWMEECGFGPTISTRVARTDKVV